MLWTISGIAVVLLIWWIWMWRPYRFERDMKDKMDWDAISAEMDRVAKEEWPDIKIPHNRGVWMPYKNL